MHLNPSLFSCAHTVVARFGVLLTGNLKTHFPAVLVLKGKAVG